MCTFDVVLYIGCSHVTVRSTACEESKSSTRKTPCEYLERFWESADICRSSTCVVRNQVVEMAREAVAAEAERNIRRHIRPIRVTRVTKSPRMMYRYTTPVADPKPRLLKYGGEYNLDVHKLYTIPEVEELAIDNVHEDPGSWSWTLHNPNVEIVKATAIMVTIKNPKPIAYKPPQLPVALRASVPSYTGNEYLAMSPCLTSPLDSVAVWQAQELARTMRMPPSTQNRLPPIPLHAPSKGQTDTEVLNLTPHRTSHYGSPAHRQATELATTKRALHLPKTRSLAIPRRVSSIGKAITRFLSLKPRRRSHFSSPARWQTEEVAATRPVTISQPTAEVPSSPRSGQIKQSFVSRVETWKGLDLPVSTRRSLENYGQSFGISPGVPLAPRMEVRLSAVGLSETGTRTSVESDIPIVYADIIEAKKDVKPAPALRSVQRMTLAFDRPDFSRVEDTDSKIAGNLLTDTSN